MILVCDGCTNCNKSADSIGRQKHGWREFRSRCNEPGMVFGEDLKIAHDK